MSKEIVANRNEGRELSERDEQLLMSYYDGECGVLGRLKVRRLVARNPRASEFLSTLDVVGSQVVEEMRAVEAPDLSNMWDRVSRRIKQEERAELFLGRRSQRAEVEPRTSWTAPLGWGLSGAAVSAAVALLIANGQMLDNQADLSRTAMNDSSRQVDTTAANIPALEVNKAAAGGPVRFVSSSEQAISPVNRPVQIGSPVEVEWVRSDGQVRFIPDTRQRTAVIWVKKRPAGGLSWSKVVSRLANPAAAIPTALSNGGSGSALENREFPVSVEVGNR